jgi:competence protein ComEC
VSPRLGPAQAPDDEVEPLDLRLVPAAVVAWLVAWQVRAVPPAWAVVLALGSAAAGAALLLHRPARAVRGRRVAAGAAAALLCAAAAGLCTAARTGARTAEPVAGLAERRAAVTVEAVLTDDPRRAAAAHAGRPVVVARVRVQRLESAGRAYRVRVPFVVLTSDEQWLGLLPGQPVRVEGALRPSEPDDDVAAVLSGRGPPRLLGRPGLLQRVAGRLRAGLRDAVAGLPEAERGLLPGLVVGDTSGLDPDLREDFRTTGLSQ